MTTVVIVEPKPLIRLGIEHYLNRVFPEIKIRSCDQMMEDDNFLLPYHCDLLLLSVKANACVQSIINSAQQQYACSKLLLLSDRSEEHTSELQSRFDLVCRHLLV